MEKELTEIYDQIYMDDSTKTPRIYITKIEGKIDYIENFKYQDYDDFFKSTRLLSDYGLMLYLMGYKKKSLYYMEIAINRFESGNYIKTKDLLDEPLYEALIFNRGKALFDLNKYKKSKIDFKRLTTKFPDNDLYNSWIKGVKIRLLYYIEGGFLILATISIILSMFDKRESRVFHFATFYGTIVGFSVGLLMLLIRTIIKKNNAS